MTNLSKTLRQRLGELPYGGAAIYDKRVSQRDGTIKYLFALEDGNLVEGVLMRYHYGNTLCISTQVGCPDGLRVLRLHPGGLRTGSTAWGNALLYCLRRTGRAGAKPEPHRHQYCADGQRRTSG